MGFSHFEMHSFLQGTQKQKTSKSYGFLIPKNGFPMGTLSVSFLWLSMVPGILGPKNATKRSWMTLGMPRDLVNGKKRRPAEPEFKGSILVVFC